MAAKQQTVRLPTAQFKGLVANPSIVDRDLNSAQFCANFLKKPNGQGTIRPGTVMRYAADTSTLRHEIMFPFTYSYHDTDTGSTQQELVALGLGMNSTFVIDDTILYRLEEANLVISYTGTGNGTIEITATSANRWTVTVKANGVTVSTFQSNSARRTSQGQLSAFVSTIHALADFNCSPTSISSSTNVTPIDFIDKSITIASGSSETITYYTRTIIGYGDYSPKAFTDADFILPSSINYSNVMYFAYGTYEYKYDGRNFYRSGLPVASINTIADSAGGATHTIGNTYIYKLVYKRIDYRGNIIEGQDSDDTLAVATHTMAATRDINLTVQNMRAADYLGHAIRAARVNGAQAAVTTITVDAGHNMEASDTAYFFNSGSGEYIEREVTAVTATTITIAAPAVTVTDNLDISNNVRIQIWRTKNDGTDFYFVDEIPNQALSSTTVYVDDVADTALVEPFVEQTRKHSGPPKCSYIGIYQGLKITAGDPDYPNRLSWALPLDVEAYPLESNNIDIKAGGLGALTGFGTIDDNQLAVFKYDGHVVVKGTLDDLSLEVKDRSSTGVGCTSFRSLCYIGENEALAGLSPKGVFIFNQGTPSLALGDGINPFIPKFQTPQVNGTNIADTDYTTAYVGNGINMELVLRRAVAINDSLNQLFHLYIPAETGKPGELKIPFIPSSRYFVYDYGAQIPYWTDYMFYERTLGEYTGTIDRNVQPNAGFTIYKNRLWLGMADYDADYTGTQASLFNFSVGDTASDYVDSTYPVYLDIEYTPYTRDASAVPFFKPLYVILEKFITDFAADPRFVGDLDSDFSFRIKLVKDFKNYAISGNPAKPTYITNVPKTFYVEQGQTSVPVKCVTSKSRAIQIGLTNEDLELGEYEQLLFDQLVLVVSYAYDPIVKDPKGING